MISIIQIHRSFDNVKNQEPFCCPEHRVIDCITLTSLVQCFSNIIFDFFSIGHLFIFVFAHRPLTISCTLWKNETIAADSKFAANTRKPSQNVNNFSLNIRQTSNVFLLWPSLLHWRVREHFSIIIFFCIHRSSSINKEKSLRYTFLELILIWYKIVFILIQLPSFCCKLGNSGDWFGSGRTP